MTRPLRIGVDARELLGDTTGVGRYLGELMRRWAARPDARRRQFLLYTPEPLPLALPAGAAEQRVIGRGAGTWWEQTALRHAVRADKPDVFYAPAYTAPLGIAMPLAVTIHDISFIAHPEWFRPRERLRRRWLTRRAAAAAAVIFTDSQFSRGELEQRLHVDPDRIRVIAPGVSTVNDVPIAERGTDPSYAGDGSASAVPREPLVLFAGSVFNRRHLPELIAAFARAAKDLPAARLVIAGADRTWPRQDLQATAADLGIAGKVEVRNYVTQAELTALYRRASGFAFLSEYEGFGLTPLEALAAGVPVVVRDTPVAREVYGDAAEYVAPGDLDATAAALRGFLTSSSAARAPLTRAPTILARYSWGRTAADTLEQLERIAGR
ncbi:MAG: glycosyltransferase family 1 protein [Acidobacteriota bacterium]